MTWRPDDPQGDEAGKIKYLIVPYTRGVGLDLGCGPKKAFPHFIGMDSGKDTELFGIEMRPDVVVKDCADLSNDVEDASCDFVFSSHLLEHIEDYKAALASWWKVLKVGGHLVLYLPHAALYPNVGQPGANPDHKHDFYPDDITKVMMDRKMHAIGAFELLVDETRADGMEYSFLQVYRKLEAGTHNVMSAYTPRPEKTACVVRYGGYGDQIQAANLLPVLKEQGYHVTFMTTPKGQDILRHDPHIDAWIIQEDNQVPNHELVAYWEAWAPRFDKFINLSESVEGTLLAMPGRANHAWPQSLRHKLLNINYLEFMHEIAELPHSSLARFYPSEEEQTFADEYLKADEFNVLFALSGSSIHKFYPHQDAVIARILLGLPKARVILVGNDACKILEAGWEEESRVTCASGEMSIRQTLTLAQQVDCVVGPETGVLNAVAFEDVKKVVLLSHSSVENLSRDWANCASLEPVGMDCYPCHRLHYGSKYCHKDAETGAALCQLSIDPERVFQAIETEYKLWEGLLRDAA